MSYPYDSKIQIKTQSLRIAETSLLRKDIIKSEEGTNVCEVDIDVFNIYSPNLKNAELIVKVRLNKLIALFHP